MHSISTMFLTAHVYLVAELENHVEGYGCKDDEAYGNFPHIRLLGCFWKMYKAVKKKAPTFAG